MDETIKQLDELSEKYTRNKKLGNKDRQKAEELLKSLFLSADTVVYGYDFMLRLPAESACKAFVSAWKCEAVDGDNLVEGLMKNREFDGVAGKYRLVELIRQFIPLDTRVAFVLLVNLAGRLTESGRKKPDVRIVSVFRKKLMDSKELLRIRLGEYGVSPRDISSISALVLMGLIDADAEGASGKKEWKMEFLKWLEQGGSVPTLSPPLVREIEKVTARWPEEIQRECLRLGLIKTVVTRIGVKPQAETSRTGQPATPSDGLEIRVSTGDVNQKEQDPGGSKVYEERSEALVHLRAVADYVLRLEREFHDVHKSLTNARFECESQRRRLVDQQRLVRELQDKNRNIELECRGLKEKLNAAERRIAELETSLDRQRIAHQREIDRLVEQMDRESQYNLQEFKNELAQSLRLLHADFIDIENETMTAELGEHLRFTIRKIFRLLEGKGVVLRE